MVLTSEDIARMNAERAGEPENEDSIFGGAQDSIFGGGNDSNSIGGGFNNFNSIGGGASSSNSGAFGNGTFGGLSGSPKTGLGGGGFGSLGVVPNLGGSPKTGLGGGFGDFGGPKTGLNAFSTGSTSPKTGLLGGIQPLEKHDSFGPKTGLGGGGFGSSFQGGAFNSGLNNDDDFGGPKTGLGGGFGTFNNGNSSPKTGLLSSGAHNNLNAGLSPGNVGGAFLRKTLSENSDPSVVPNANGNHIGNGNTNGINNTATSPAASNSNSSGPDHKRQKESDTPGNNTRGPSVTTSLQEALDNDNQPTKLKLTEDDVKRTDIKDFKYDKDAIYDDDGNIIGKKGQGQLACVLPALSGGMLGPILNPFRADSYRKIDFK